MIESRCNENFLYAFMVFLLSVAILLTAQCASARETGTYLNIKRDPVDNTIVLEASQVHLSDVLRQVEQRTGIRMHASESVSDVKINKNIEAMDWEEAIDVLLEDFNTIQIAGGKKGLLSVRILGQKERGATSSAVPGTKPQRSSASRSPDNNSSVLGGFTETQWRELAKGPYRGPLPNQLLEDPAYREFLAKHGVKSTDDLQDIRKAIRVRRDARKQLHLIRKQRRKNRRR